MNLIRYLSIALIIFSLLGGGYMLRFYSLDANNVNDQVFQAIGVLSTLLFIVGIALAFMSKPKKEIDIVKEVAAIQREAVENRGPADGIGRPAEALPFASPAPMVEAMSQPPRSNLSFEEEMAMRKKAYYSEAARKMEEGRALTPPTQQASSAPAPLPSNIRELIREKPPEKVSFTIPFGGPKKPDLLRDILNKEEKDLNEAKPWRQKSF
jgi:hypothetical protein